MNLGISGQTKCYECSGIVRLHAWNYESLIQNHENEYLCWDCHYKFKNGEKCMKEYEAIRNFKYSTTGMDVIPVKKGDVVSLNSDQGDRFQKCAFIKSIGRDEGQGSANEKTDPPVVTDPPKEDNNDSADSGTVTDETGPPEETGSPEDDATDSAASEAVTDKVNWMELDQESLIKYALSENIEVNGDMSLEDIQMAILEKESQ